MGEDEELRGAWGMEQQPTNRGCRCETLGELLCTSDEDLIYQTFLFASCPEKFLPSLLITHSYTLIQCDATVYTSVPTDTLTMLLG